jgi:hypothetical protein
VREEWRGCVVCEERMFMIEVIVSEEEGQVKRRAK